MASTWLVVVIVIVALGFDFTNGFHDSANAIATSVSTKALTPRVALALAAVMNVVGCTDSTKVAATVGKGIIAAPSGRGGLVIVLSGLIGAIIWNLGTWYFGLPSSSSHALIGGLVGAALAGVGVGEVARGVGEGRDPDGRLAGRRIPLGYLFMLSLLWGFRRANAVEDDQGLSVGPDRLSRDDGLRARDAGCAEDHGRHRADPGRVRPPGTQEGIPVWVILCSAAAISLGTYSGGWRIMRTLGRRIFKLTR